MPPFAPHFQLTPYQHKLINLRLTGLTRKEIAGRCKVAESTIEYHFGKIYKGLRIRGFEQLPNAYYEYRKARNLPAKEMLEEIFSKETRL